MQINTRSPRAHIAYHACDAVTGVATFTAPRPNGHSGIRDVGGFGERKRRVLAHKAIKVINACVCVRACERVCACGCTAVLSGSAWHLNPMRQIAAVPATSALAGDFVLLQIIPDFP